MLTEAEVQKKFSKLFTNAEVSEELLEKAETLIDQLRFESPLRHRLTEELDEIKKITVSSK